MNPTSMPGLDAATEQALWQAARRVRQHAYAPYSGFAVGAALLDERGVIHVGCNVENAAYPQGQCAEANAIAALVATGARRIRAALVLGAAPQWVTPCGGCRQRLREFAADDTPILIAHPEHGVQVVRTLGQLLPLSFGPDHLQTAASSSS
ncbi:cytidine deaminase [Tepidimonas taiwanensis]|uniref:Cytidine deaminase n=1 Tax=Tepidimonas taiwanensis TaxID=307486 RepID=A0A554X3A3_9BURK|nr:cytidine deaminase [Tepidimonas taiwanensis]MCX7693635.1 cytidine deaminase [Tepidimonas taiwanensis]MDM7462787.1 cytidine deaminase [Tepidimonas taiwanensis]TSE30273.1 Cytidine deaminase [Tepidimonas taiwanensis]UBQ04792.1 cytidine deaminase [Tepidimonas taiwanensis]